MRRLEWRCRKIGEDDLCLARGGGLLIDSSLPRIRWLLGKIAGRERTIGFKAFVLGLLLGSGSPAAAQAPGIDSQGSIGAASGASPLQVGDLRRIARLDSLTTSPDGRFVAYRLRSGGDARLRIFDTARHVERDAASLPALGSFALAWSPDSRKLAILNEQGGSSRIWIARLGEDEIDVSNMPVAAEASRNRLAWLPDNVRLLLQTAPAGVGGAAAETNGRSDRRDPPAAATSSQTATPAVRVYTLATPQTGAESTAPNARSSCGGRFLYSLCDLSILDTGSGILRVVISAKKFGTFAVADHSGTTYVAYTELVEEDRDSQTPLVNLVVHDLRSGHSWTALERVSIYPGRTFVWAPDGSRLAVAAERLELRGSGEHAQNVPAALFAIEPLRRRVERVSGQDLVAGREPVFWDAAGRSVYARSVRGDILHYTIGARSWTSARSNLALPLDRLLGVDADGGIIAEARETDGRNVILRVDRAGQIHRLPGTRSIASASFSAGCGCVDLVASGAQLPSRLARLTVDGAPVANLSDPNAWLQSFNLGQTRLVQWNTAGGRSLSGALLLPRNHVAGQRLPLVVWVYGGIMGSRYAETFGLSHVQHPTFNMQILASRGYAVFFPDTPTTPGHPARDIADAVIPGVQAVVDAGYADPDRLAIMGQSYGSYSVLSVITRTRQFKAAVITGVLHPDLIASYLSLHATGASVEIWAERGQGQMGGSPWAFPDRYIANSPIYAFDRISTPVLIGQGDADSATPPVGAAAVFVALRRLGVSVEYRLYAGEDHVVDSPANVEDFWRRRLDFLAEHLDVALDAAGRLILDNGRARSRQPAAAIRAR